jgi:hypothetical protein
LAALSSSQAQRWRWFGWEIRRLLLLLLLLLLGTEVLLGLQLHRN